MRVLLVVLLVGIVGCGGDGNSPGDDRESDFTKPHWSRTHDGISLLHSDRQLCVPYGHVTIRPNDNESQSARFLQRRTNPGPTGAVARTRPAAKFPRRAIFN